MRHHKRPVLVAITGGIASGKSIVSNWFENKGLAVFYADKIGHEVLNESNIQNKITNMFGKDIIINNKIDRGKLGEIVFNSESKRKQLNDLLHPEIRKRIQQIIDSSNEKILIFEIPLLFENGLHKAFDLTVNISADKELRLNRVMKRDGLSKESIQKRIDAQIHESQRKELADVNIINNNDFDDLFLKLGKLKTQIINLKNAKS